MSVLFITILVLLLILILLNQRKIKESFRGGGSHGGSLGGASFSGGGGRASFGGSMGSPRMSSGMGGPRMGASMGPGISRGSAPGYNQNMGQLRGGGFQHGPRHGPRHRGRYQNNYPYWGAGALGALGAGYYGANYLNNYPYTTDLYNYDYPIVQPVVYTQPVVYDQPDDS
jgi:hypothetical protein